MNQINKPWLYQANFPASQAGKLGDVYYTVYKADGSYHTVKTSLNIIEFSSGAYGVSLTFSNEGSYSIHWEIDNTPYVANEEIRIYDFSDVTVSVEVPDVYQLYGT